MCIQIESWHIPKIFDRTVVQLANGPVKTGPSTGHTQACTTRTVAGWPLAGFVHNDAEVVDVVDPEKA